MKAAVTAEEGTVSSRIDPRFGRSRWYVPVERLVGSCCYQTVPAKRPRQEQKLMKEASSAPRAPRSSVDLIESQAALEAVRAAEHRLCLMCGSENKVGLKLRFRAQAAFTRGVSHGSVGITPGQRTPDGDHPHLAEAGPQDHPLSARLGARKSNRE
jgi:hypothetical protein